MVGRHIKLNAEVTSIICKSVELGLSYNLAAQSAGITFQTFNQWMKEAEDEKDDIYIEFATKVRAAEAACAKQCMELVREAAGHGTWNAAAWLLERRYKNDYGRTERVDLKNEHSGQVKIELRTEDCGED